MRILLKIYKSFRVFVGNISKRVRELLWTRLCENNNNVRGAVMIYSSPNTEQGYEMILAGTPKREIVDFDGISLVKIHL